MFDRLSSKTAIFITFLVNYAEKANNIYSVENYFKTAMEMAFQRFLSKISSWCQKCK